MHTLKPTVGEWYLRHDNGQRFEVISGDDGDGAIELQYEDGAIDEIDAESWFELDLELSGPPDDFSAVLEVAEPDEADGGDPVNSDIPDAALLRVANEELLDPLPLDAAEDDWDKGMPAEYIGPDADTLHPSQNNR